MRPARRLPWVWLILFAALTMQIGTARWLRPLRPGIEEMPYPLGDQGLKGLSLGDDQFLFRALARWLQDVGDGGGRVRPLRDYDYDRVVGWLKALDGLDPRSEYLYWLGSHYFGAITDPGKGPEKVAKVVDYFRTAALADPEHRWSWLVWAAVKAHHTVKDKALMAKVAADLVSLKGRSDIPAWLPLLAIPLYRAAGDGAAAKALEDDPMLRDIRSQDWRDFQQRLGL
jgi:hypothetical protein